MFAAKSSRTWPGLSMCAWTAATPKACASKSSAAAKTLVMTTHAAWQTGRPLEMPSRTQLLRTRARFST
eukprot:6330010-Alexandrium_andersonii.AAC.1